MTVKEEIEIVERKLKDAFKRSDACPWCSDVCWCDGDWSPAAEILRLEDELNRLKHKKLRYKSNRRD